MNTSKKKDLILCDYCGIYKDGSQIYNVKKQFADCKIVDILQLITKRSIPVTASIKVCSMCASTLHATTGAMEKATKMVDRFLNRQVTETAAKSDAITNNVNKSTSDTNNELPVANTSPKKLLKKSKQSDQSTTQQMPQKGTETVQKKGSKTKMSSLSTSISISDAAQSSPKKQQTAKVKQDESLNNAVKLTPANNVNKKFNEVDQLFGSSNINASDSEDENDDDGEVLSSDPEVKNIAIGFVCKLCDYESTYPNPMKVHLKDIHKQQRPRIFHCFKCPKSYGVLKSLKKHLLTHGISEQKNMKKVGENQQLDKTQQVPQAELDKSAGPQLAVLTALQPKQKPIDNVLNGEYTFAITDTNSSTPKPAVEKQVPAHQCDICHLNHDNVKRLQEHLKIVHQINRPKSFKCGLCESSFMQKSSLDRHIKKKHDTTEKKAEMANTKTTPNRRNTINIESKPAMENTKETKSTPKRRKTVCIEPGTAKKPNLFKSSVDVQVLSKPDEIDKSEKLTSPKKLKAAVNATDSSKLTELSEFMEEICDNIDLISMESLKANLENKYDVETSPGPPLKKSKNLSKIKEIDNSEDEQESFASNKKKQKQVSGFNEDNMDDVGFISMEDIMGISTQIDEDIPLEKSKHSSAHNDLTVVESPIKTKLNGIFKKDKAQKKNISIINNESDVVDNTQLSTVLNGSTKKAKKKRKATEDINSSQNEEDMAKLKNHKSGKKSKPNKRDTSITDIEESNEVTTALNGSTEKAKKRKATEDINSSQNEEDMAKLKKHKSGKKSKLNKRDTSTDIEGFNEVNKNVKPHKREMRESFALSDSELSCRLCGKVVSSRKRLDSHTLNKHSLKCDNCKGSYPDSMQYIGHFEACDASEGFACGVKNCIKVFTAANYLDSHLKNIHNFS